MSNLVYILAGIYLMAMGLAGRTFLGEPDVAATEDLEGKARPLRRFLVTAMGFLIFVYGIYWLARYFS